MIVKKVDLEQKEWSKQRVTIELSYSELSKICNLIAKMEMKNPEDYNLKYEFACLHDFCHDYGIKTTLIPKHIWPKLAKEAENFKEADNGND